MPNITNTKDAINFNIEGIHKVLSDTQIEEFKKLIGMIKVLNKIKNGDLTKVYYINLLPEDAVKTILVGKTLINSWGRKCTITNVSKKKDRYGKLKYLVTMDVPESKNRTNDTYLNTLMGEGVKINGVPERYTTLVTKGNVDSYINHIKDKYDNYMNLYNQTVSDSNKVLQDTVKAKENTSVVAKEAIQRAKVSIRHDTKKAVEAWEDGLSSKEKNTLYNWIRSNVYSMRLYVLKDGAYDKAVTELFPDEQYGKKRRSEATPVSKDHIDGYISFNNIDNAPMEIIQKIFRRTNADDSFRKSELGNKYRLNNYMLVLYLLQNYNHNGFKTGITNLNKYVK